MTQTEINNFTKKELKDLDCKYLTREEIIGKLIPKLICYNEEYNLSQDVLLSDIGQTVIETQCLENLSEDPALYIGLGLGIANKLS